MITIQPFAAADAMAIMLQPAQHAEATWHERQHIERVFAEAVNAFTARDATGRVLFCGGAVERHAGYASLWGLFALGKRAAIFRLMAATRQFIAGLPHARVDAMVADTFAARRWAELVGLTYETRLRGAAPDGGDMLVYRRIS